MAQAHKPQAQTPPPAPPPKEGERVDETWREMKIAPKDGTFILLKGDTRNIVDFSANEWWWYKTRKYQMGRFVPCGWWRPRFGPNMPPSFKPEGWRYAKEGWPDEPLQADA